MTEKLRRLIDLPGVDALEYRAVLKREFAEPEARAEHPEIDACAKSLFGLTADEAEAAARPAGWDDIELKAPAVQAAAFEAEGWDVTDNKRRPLRVLAHFSGPLWLAVRGVAGTLPGAQWEPEKKSDSWGSKLAEEARQFRKR
ncbi:MAG TPA: hypothetical protein VHW60_06020 [Caulobacteraceae bacterium]|jgi:hypothetical protein|nr:hypothetical protein [Caulobacteraceae bacterium]